MMYVLLEDEDDSYTAMIFWNKENLEAYLSDAAIESSIEHFRVYIIDPKDMYVPQVQIKVKLK